MIRSLLFLVLLACARGPHGARNPFEEARLVNQSLTATLVKATTAGGYTYLDLTSSDGGRLSLVIMGDVPDGAELQLHAYAELSHFHSKRLNRDFSPLLFGSVTSSRKVVP